MGWLVPDMTAGALDSNLCWPSPAPHPGSSSGLGTVEAALVSSGKSSSQTMETAGSL